MGAYIHIDKIYILVLISYDNQRTEYNLEIHIIYYQIFEYCTYFFLNDKIIQEWSVIQRSLVHDDITQDEALPGAVY